MELEIWFLRNSEKANLFTFGRDKRDQVRTEREKTISKWNEKFGFEVSYKAFKTEEAQNIANLSYTADGVYYYEVPTEEGLYECVTTKLTGLIPHSVINQYDGDNLVRTIYKMCYGFIVQSNPENTTSTVSFNDLKNISAKGILNFEKIKFKFKGTLWYKNKELGSFSLKKANFTNLLIKYDGSVFTNMNSFYEFVQNKMKETFDDENVYGCSIPKKRRQVKPNLEIVGDVISNIKSHNNCIIM